MVIENSQIERSKTTIFRYKTGYKGRATTVVGFGEIFVVCSDPEWLDMKGSLISALFHDRCAVSESCGAQFTWCDHTCAVYRQILVIIALRYRSTYHLYCSTRKKLTVDTCFLVFVSNSSARWTFSSTNVLRRAFMCQALTRHLQKKTMKIQLMWLSCVDRQPACRMLAFALQIKCSPDFSCGGPWLQAE